MVLEGPKTSLWLKKLVVAVEIKSFLGTSLVNEFHKAIGQVINYRYALQKKEPARVLYLAIPDETYRSSLLPALSAGLIKWSVSIVTNYRLSNKIIIHIYFSRVTQKNVFCKTLMSLDIISIKSVLTIEAKN